MGAAVGGDETRVGSNCVSPSSFFGGGWVGGRAGGRGAGGRGGGARKEVKQPEFASMPRLLIDLYSLG
jgi:hypothetical protein